MFELAVLGPLEMCNAAGPVDLGSPKQRTTLAVLVLNVGTVVPLNVLIDRVWGADPPTQARSALYSYVSRLRKVIECSAGGAEAGLGSSAIVRRQGGYVLNVVPQALDLWRFRQLILAARQESSVRRDRQAGELLRRALSLWRGEPLSNACGGWAIAVREQLQREHLAAVTARIDVELRLNRHAEVVLELSELVASNPLDEHVVAQYLVALFRSGRRAQALECYAQVRRHIGDALGIEPSSTLQQLFGDLLCVPDAGVQAASTRGRHRVADTAPTANTARRPGLRDDRRPLPLVPDHWIRQTARHRYGV